MTNTNLTEILSQQDIDTLKQGYMGKAVAAAAIKSFSTPFPPAGDFARAITNQFYAEAPTEDQMSARDRELAMIAMLCDVPDKNFETHVYLALMEGLSPTLIVNTVYLASLYKGAELWSAAAEALARTFERLKASAGAGADDSKMPAVLGALRK